MKITVTRAKSIAGTLRGPSDKSLTHRAYMFGAAARGKSCVRQPLRGEDCESTLQCLRQMGLTAEWQGDGEVVLTPAPSWLQPKRELDCGNSGTTMRLLSGLVASRPISVTMIGDASLSRRPMGRIATPLRLMGANIEGDRPPLTIKGSDSLKAIHYQSPVASAQIKSCVLLAGLRADGPTSVTEPSESRDHTERMLRAMGAEVTSANGTVSVKPTDELTAFEITIPADISSAAFLIAAAALLPDGQILFKDLSVNPTRTGILDVLEMCGVPVDISGEREELGEPVADVEIRAPKVLKPFRISGALVPRLIDEIPVLAVLATQCEGTSVIQDAGELRVKESDRIELMASGLRGMGANVETRDDGLEITGPTPLKGAKVEAHGDHRIAMSFAIAGLLADGETEIEGAESIATSFPDFESELKRLIVV